MKITPKKTACKGFSILELLVAMAIVGILSSLALPSYQENVLKAQLVEATLVLGSMRDEIVANHLITGELPSTVFTAGNNETVAYQESGVIRDIRFRNTSNNRYTRGWVRVRFENDLIAGCVRNKCGVYLGFIERNGELDFYCGHWNAAWNSIPLNLMPANCRESSVSSSYRR